MPLDIQDDWRYVCAVCGISRRVRPGQYPYGWARMVISRLPRTIGVPPHGRFEDHVCSLECGMAVLRRQWDTDEECAQRDLELARVAARDARWPS